MRLPLTCPRCGDPFGPGPRCPLCYYHIREIAFWRLARHNPPHEPSEPVCGAAGSGPRRVEDRARTAEAQERATLLAEIEAERLALLRELTASRNRGRQRPWLAAQIRARKAAADLQAGDGGGIVSGS